MHANLHTDDADLPSIDDTIAAMSDLRRILDDLRCKLAVTEQTAARLAQEKRHLQIGLQKIVQSAASGATPPSAIYGGASTSGRSLNELSALVKKIDGSFNRHPR